MTAVISSCGAYRYRLDREWLGDGRAVWVMLNPSTADATLDDPTIRRCIGFSKAWGLGALTVVNVFALRATDPKTLVGHVDPVGPANDLYIEAALDGADIVIAAWGQSWPRQHRERVAKVGAMLNGRAHHLGLTKSGQPTHPLYRPSGCAVLPWGSTGRAET